MQNPTASQPSPATATHREAEAFTLIELLIVVAIIGILASLAFPAVNGALQSSKKAQARNDVHQLAAAVKNYQAEYGRLPSTQAGSDSSVDNKTLIDALTTTNTLNPRGIVFFEPKATKSKKGGLDSDGKYYDPWGKEYNIQLDTSYDNKITDGSAYFTTVIVKSSGPDGNMGTTNDNISNVK